MTSTNEWYTPPFVIAALGGPKAFDLDPCAPRPQLVPTARAVFTKRENGLCRKWDGRIWLNPPYSKPLLEQFLAKMVEHRRGTALLFARVATSLFHRYVWQEADGLLFLKGRLDFIGRDGKKHHGAWEPPVLCAYGQRDLNILAACEIDGQFVPLRFPRSVLATFFAPSNEDEKISTTWARALADFFVTRNGPVPLDELYRHFAGHRKAAANPNFKAKLRQQLQRGPYRNVRRGEWKAEAENAA